MAKSTSMLATLALLLAPVIASTTCLDTQSVHATHTEAVRASQPIKPVESVYSAQPVNSSEPIDSAKPAPSADLVFHNGSIYTLDAQSSKVAALAVKNGIITFVGSNAGVARYISNATKVVNLNGRAVTPGLVDAHMHVLSGGLFLLKCDLNYQPLDLQAVLQHIQSCIDGETDKGDDAWLEVVNMDYPSLVTRSGQVGKDKLDTLKTKRPLLIRSSDYHTVLVNSRALELSSITANTPNPSNGIIERLAGNEPSGVLQDSASSLLSGPPPPTAEENVEAGRAALKLIRQAGITTFQEAAAGEDHHTLFQTLQSNDELSARAYFDYRIEAPNSTAGVDALVAQTLATLSPLHDNSTLQPKPSLKWQAVKLFLDGVITYPASTAALIDPYWLPVNGSDTLWAADNSTLVKPYWSPEILTRTLEGLFLGGIDAQLHADGDLAVRIALNAAESFRKNHPTQDFRLGVAHDELSHPDDWPRFAKLGVDAIMSFQWSQLSSFYLPSTFASLADYRLKNLQAYAQIEKAGRPVVYGSDWPVRLLFYGYCNATNTDLRLIPSMSSLPLRLVSLAEAIQKTPTPQHLRVPLTMAPSLEKASHAKPRSAPSPPTVQSSFELIARLVR
jgi:predicted amidohydrolase YtcJ